MAERLSMNCIDTGSVSWDLKQQCPSCADSGRTMFGDICMHHRPLPVEAPRCAPREHTATADCWCHPEAHYTDPDTGATVYVHRGQQ